MTVLASRIDLGGASTAAKAAGRAIEKAKPDALLTNARAELSKLVTQSLTADYIYPGSKPPCSPFALTLKKVAYLI